MNNTYRKDRSYIKQRLEYVSPVRYIKELETEIEKLNYIIDKQDKDIKTLSKGNKRLKNKINKFAKDFNDYLDTNPLVSLDDYYRNLEYILMLERDIPEDFKFIKTIKGMVKELKGSDE